MFDKLTLIHLEILSLDAKVQLITSRETVQIREIRQDLLNFIYCRFLSTLFRVSPVLAGPVVILENPSGY